MTSGVASNREEAMIEPALDTAIDIATSLSNLMNSAALINERRLIYRYITYCPVIFCYIIYSSHLFDYKLYCLSSEKVSFFV